MRERFRARAHAVRGRLRTAFWRVCGVMLLGLGVWGAWAELRSPGAWAEQPAAPGPARPAPVSPPLPPDVPTYEIADAPQRFAGQVVSVTAAIETVYASRLFVLDEDRFGAGPAVWMLLKRPLPLEEDMVVTVTGVVRAGITPRIAEEYELGQDIAPALLARLRTQPVLLAASVHTPDGVELLPHGRVER